MVTVTTLVKVVVRLAKSGVGEERTKFGRVRGKNLPV